VTALTAKLTRDLWATRGQALAIALLVACAVAALIASRGTHQSLLASRDAYYDRYRFADVFADLRRAPDSVAARLAAIPGVQEVEARIVTDVPLVLPGFDEPVTARLIGVPGDGAGPRLDALHLRRGRALAPGETGAALVSEAFAQAHGLRPGDRLRAIVAGRRRDLHLVGVALSPEYIYQIRPGDVMPDDAHFAVLWTNRETLAPALDMAGSFNHVALRLVPGADERAVIARVDRALSPYGGAGATGRAHQVSHRFVSDEITQLKIMAAVVPAIFLAVAAFLLTVVLGRTIAMQREQIATLKAFGYSTAAVAAHYLAMAAVIVLAGAAMGVAGGYVMGRAMTEMYTTMFRLPLLVYRPELSVIGLAAALSLGAALAGSARSVLAAAALPPAVAMRPEPPATYRPTALERWAPRAWASPMARMILRQLGRRPWRTALSSLGIAFAVAILVVASFFGDALDRLVAVQFREAQRDDVAVTFVAPRPGSAVRELCRLPGVRGCEPARAVGVVLRSGPASYRTAVVGVAEGARLRRVVGADGRVEPAPAAGLMLTAPLAEILDVSPGDRVDVELLEGRRATRPMVVRALSTEMVGVAGYASFEELDRLTGDRGVVSGAVLSVDPVGRHELYGRVREMPGVAGVTLRSSMIEGFERISAEHLLVMSGILALLASMIACGVVYNAARVSAAERERELATLRVIGFTRAEVSLVLLGELAVQVGAALPAGCVIGGAAAWVLAVAMSSDLFRLPATVAPTTYAFAMAVVVAAALCVALLVRRRLDRLSLVEVLKTKE
jgi:putative ABC transport system permease protein